MTESPPILKRLARSFWSAIPRSALSFNLGKILTRTLLRPEHASRPVSVKFAGRIPMTLDLGTFVANDLYCLDDHYESVTLRLWRDLARRSSTILDVGSHIGTFALVAADANPQARVLCVEADGTIFERLRIHAAAYPSITALHAAIADRETLMWFCPVGGNDGGGYLAQERPADPRSYAITTLTLNALCTAYGIAGIDLMKMDVEGFEHVLLVGDDNFFSAHAPEHLIVELTIDKEHRERTDRLFAAMRRRGYVARRLQGLYAIPFGKPDDLANWYFHRPAQR